MSKSIYWYDLETWGIDPKYFQVAQFAGIRTDLELNIIGKPTSIYCQLLPDYLPDPGAVLVTGTTPQKAKELGMPEPKFTKAVLNELNKTGTISSGFNTLRFDDEFIRYMLYRNFYDPYEREWKDGNGRWDIIDLARAARALRPEGIEWPVDEEGRSTNRLEALTAANGISHKDAHDALADVKATIEFAKLIKDKQGQLYEYAFNLREKNEVESLLKQAIATSSVLAHTTGKLPNVVLNTSAVAIIGQHPVQKNKYIVVDLREDLAEFMEMPADELKVRTFVNKDELNGETRLPVKEVHIGKSPFLAPMSVIDEEAADRIKLDLGKVQAQAQSVYSDENFKSSVLAMYENQSFDEQSDVDAQLYQGFFNDSDRSVVNQLRVNKPEDWEIKSSNPRINKLAERFKARHFPELLDESKSLQWKEFVASKLTEKYRGRHLTFDEFGRRLAELAKEKTDDSDAQFLLEELQLYGQSVYPVAETER